MKEKIVALIHKLIPCPKCKRAESREANAMVERNRSINKYFEEFAKQREAQENQTLVAPGERDYLT